jgi:uncharacterized repeat protein (TIGR03803 family)
MRLTYWWRAFLLAFALLAGSAGANAAIKETVLYSFDEANNGAYPVAGLVADAKGNLYGTTELAGAKGAGIVYELTPNSDGTWTFTLLHTFDISSEGGDPLAGLVFDNAGNLYGTTSIGGPNDAGSVYQLTPTSTGWSFKVIYAFSQGRNAGFPGGPLLFDGKNTLYGTASGGSKMCTFGCGTVYQLKQSKNGIWNEKVIYRFQEGKGGYIPAGGVIRDSSGNLYGTTLLGGLSQCDAGCGTIFKLSPSGNGWKESTLYRFKSKKDGYQSYGGLAVDKSGALYGATSLGGDVNCNPPNGCGTVFRLSSTAKHTVLHAFGKTSGDGMFPMAGPTLAASGTLYGTTDYGGKLQSCGSDGCGLVYQVKGGKLTVLYNFNGSDGAQPQAQLLWGGAGHLFGTTFSGGAGEVGEAFELSF